MSSAILLSIQNTSYRGSYIFFRLLLAVLKFFKWRLLDYRFSLKCLEQKPKFCFEAKIDANKKLKICYMQCSQNCKCNHKNVLISICICVGTIFDLYASQTGNNEKKQYGFISGNIKQSNFFM